MLDRLLKPRNMVTTLGMNWLERQFKLTQNNTTVKTEVLAGLTTFLTMAYIIFVNPTMLANAGMDKGAVFVATCLAAMIGCFIMGLLANYPVAQAPGMGLNAFFTYTVVLGMGHSWQVALGAVFLSGLCFILLSIFSFYCLAKCGNRSGKSCNFGTSWQFNGIATGYGGIRIFSYNWFCTSRI